MKTKNLHMHPRVLANYAKTFEFNLVWDMERRNEGKIRCFPWVFGIIMILALAILPFLAPNSVRDVVAMMSICCSVPIVWATVQIHSKWVENRSSWFILLGFYQHFIETYRGRLDSQQVIPYRMMEKVVQDEFTILAMDVLESVEEKDKTREKKLRATMREHFDVAIMFLSHFDGGFGYRYFFQEAEVILPVRSFDPVI